MKQIGMNLVRVTEAAAIMASHWVGSGNKVEADRAATDAMRSRLDGLEWAGVIKIGEGIKDGSVGLFKGEEIGVRDGKNIYDIAVDPIDGTTPTVTSGPEAMSVIALSQHNTMAAIEDHYMHKLAYGPHIRNLCRLDIRWPLEQIIHEVKSHTGKPYNKIMVCILNRPRHDRFIKILREMGVRIKLIQDCDISGAIASCRPESGIDLLYGIGGAPESVITAAAIKCLRGGFQSQIADKDGNLDNKVYDVEDLVAGPCVFSATGITNGSMLEGVRFDPGPITHSVFMRSESGTVRWLTTHHGN